MVFGLLVARVSGWNVCYNIGWCVCIIWYTSDICVSCMEPVSHSLTVLLGYMLSPWQCPQLVHA